MRAAPLRALADGALMARFFGTSTPTVLALHGWGRDGADFTEVLDGIPAIAPDLPGFGYSPPPGEVWGAAEYADQVARLLPEMDPPVVVVGHSFGGRVAVCLATRRPGRVSGLVLAGVPLLRGPKAAGPPLSYRLIRWGHRRGMVSDERLESVRRRRGSSDYRAARGVMRDVLVKVVNESYEEQLDTLSVPVDLIWGTDDREVPVERARLAYRRLREGGCRVRLQTLDGAGHDLPLSRPQVLREAIQLMLGGAGR